MIPRDSPPRLDEAGEREVARLERQIAAVRADVAHRRLETDAPGRPAASFADRPAAAEPAPAPSVSSQADRTQADELISDRDDAAAERDRAASTRDRTAAGRDESQAAADRRTSDREHAAADRGRAAADRDQTASERDRFQARADRRNLARDQAGADRDRGAAARDRSQAEADQRSSNRDQAADDRARAADDNDMTASDRDQAQVEADQRISDRDQAGFDREQAARDREDAARDRAAATTERARAKAELRHAQHDQLTGAFGRELGRAVLEGEINRARHGDGRLVLAYVDVDGLKQVNDGRGHAVGDALLRTMVDAIHVHLRSYDPVVRVGGDEFVCALAGTTTDEARCRFQAIGATMRETWPAASFSVGFAALRPEDTLDQLTLRGDTALLGAKRLR